MRRSSTKQIVIYIPNDIILKRLVTTPTFNRLSRQKLKVGENIETVNMKQYSDMVRLYPIIGVSVREI